MLELIDSHSEKNTLLYKYDDQLNCQISKRIVRFNDNC